MFPKVPPPKKNPAYYLTSSYNEFPWQAKYSMPHSYNSYMIIVIV